MSTHLPMTPEANQPRSQSGEPIVVNRWGEGPEVVFVHGGAAPSATWQGIASLRNSWTLTIVYRRGFPPSPPPPGGSQDFEIDAADLSNLLDGRPHVVAHSYGALAALIAAVHRPAHLRSLTLLEPPIYLPAGDPQVAEFQRMGDEVLTGGLDSDPVTLRRFLRIAGARLDDDGPLPDQVARGVRRAQGSRSPGEAKVDFDVLRRAQVPTLVVSGAHNPVIELMADATAEALNAQRLVVPGAGHFVANAPGFAAQLDDFLLSSN